MKEVFVVSIIICRDAAHRTAEGKKGSSSFSKSRGTLEMDVDPPVSGIYGWNF